MLTIAPPFAVLIMAGMACLESRNIVSTLTCMTRRYSSGFSSTTLPRLPMPTLLSRKSSRPQRSTAASTSRLQSASSVTSPAWVTAVPPSALIISTVRSASFLSRSATTTLVPARASRIAAARPLPMPSPAAPPPETIATLPAKPASSSDPFIASPFDPRCQRGPTPAKPSCLVPVDAKRIGLRLDVPRIGAGEVGGAEKCIALGAVLQQAAPAFRRQVLIPTELARPLRVIDLDRVMHDVAREAGLPVAVPEVDGDRARRVAGIVLDGEQWIGLVVDVDDYRTPRIDDRQHRIVERAVIDLAFALLAALAFPVGVLALGEQVLGVGERRHPAAVDQLGVPADMVDMQMRAHHEIDRFGRTTAGAQALEKRCVEIAPAGVGALLVVAETSVDQDGVPGRLDDPRMDRADEPVGPRLDMLGQHPALVRVERFLVELGKHAIGLEARSADFLDLLDGGIADLAHDSSLEGDDAADRL